MGNPSEIPKTQVNVKSIRVDSWEKAKRGAAQCGDSMGAWLSDAIDQRATRDENAIEIPGNPTGNPQLSPDQLTARIAAVAALSNATAALRQTTGRAIGSRALGVCLKSLQQHVGMAEGLSPVRTVGGKAGGKEVAVIGQSVIEVMEFANV